MRVFSAGLELVRIGRLSGQEKDRAILVLRKQLATAGQQLNRPGGCHGQSA
jgi:hypothetical protein